MNTLVLILARKNSVRIKNKNAKFLGKYPLVLYTIKIAKKNFRLKEIMLFSDDQKIREIGKKNKIFSPRRISRISKFNTSSYITAKHAIEIYEKEKKLNVSTVVLLQPTSPFRKSTTIAKALKLFKKEKFSKSLVSVSLKKIKTIEKKINVFVPNGLIFIIKKNELYRKKNFINNNSILITTFNQKENLDLDTKKDWKIAQSIISI